MLAVDWCKYNDCVLATGSVDKSIKIWDVRIPDREITLLAGHSYAVRRCGTDDHVQGYVRNQSG